MGRLIVNVRGYGGGTGDYEVHLTERMVHPITIGNPITDDLSAGSLWEFEEEAGQAISIALDEVSFDARLELIDDQGIVLVQADAGLEGEGENISGFVVPQTGAYRISVAGHEADTGEYSLVVNKSVPDLIEIDADPTLANTAEQSLWRFAGRAGQIVTIEMNDVDFDAVVELISVDGAVLENRR